ncbi:MAG: tetratricopeptide repeat protein [Planctomycetes bacterium]|nr:tetratricopeptide repeat protein [Planctomycetota bacterium]
MIRFRSPGLFVAAFAALIIYFGAAGFEFVYDDAARIGLNPAAKSVAGFADFLSPGFWANLYFPPGAAGNTIYQPMTDAMYAFGWWIGGGGAGAFHIINILIHAANVALVYIFARRFLNEWGAAAAAFAFAIFPAHVESVAAVRGMSQTLGCFFGLLACVFYLNAADGFAGEKPASNRRRAAAHAIGAFACASFALFSNAAAAGLLPAVVVMDLICTKNWLPKRIAPAGAFAAACIVYYLARAAIHGVDAGFYLHSTELKLPEWRYRTLRFELFHDYLGELAWPFKNNAFSTISLAIGESSAELRAAWWSSLAAVAAAAALVAASVKLPRLRRPAAFGLLLLLSVAPRVVDPKHLDEPFFAECYVYIPSFAFCFFIGWILENIAAYSLSIAYIPAVLLFGAYGWTSHERLPVWRDDASLLAQSRIDSPDSTAVSTALGKLIFSQYGNNKKNETLEAAVAEFKKAVDGGVQSRVWVPDRDILDSFVGIASVRMIQGRAEDALSIYDQIITKYPSYVESYMWAGIALTQLGNHELAEARFLKALELKPDYAICHATLGEAYISRGMLAKAVESLRRAVAIDPSLTSAQLALATALFNDGKPAQAAAIISKTLAEHPDLPNARQLREFLDKLK